MDIVTWIVVGLIAGVVAKYLMGGGPSGWILTIVLGMIGAVVGGIVGRLSGLGGSGLSVMGLALAILGAIIVLFAYRALSKYIK